MSCRKKLLSLVTLLIVAISVSSCISVSPEETKESKLKEKRDKLVEWKEEAQDRRRQIFKDMTEYAYNRCLREKSLREEPRDCDKEKQESLELYRRSIQVADDRVNEIRREIKELEQSGSTNENSSK